jgi:hypothetical protein
MDGEAIIDSAFDFSLLCVCFFSCFFISFNAENYVKTLLCAVAEVGINFIFSKKILNI